MLIVGIGGTLRPDSSCEQALRISLNEARLAGADVIEFVGADIQLPFYNPADRARTEEAARLVEALRRCDGLIVASASYHGTVSGLVKNALDYTEDLANDTRTYLDGLPVGCIGIGMGPQGAANCVRTLRDIAHSLRAFPTPYGAAINNQGLRFQDGGVSDPQVAEALARVGAQTVALAAGCHGVAQVAS